MGFLELALRRRSIRRYRPDPVPDELLRRVLQAGALAPSACNRQPWGFVVVRDPERRAALNAAYPRDWFTEAPLVIAVCADTEQAWRREDGKVYGDIDAAIAADHLALAAADLGLGACWVCHFDEERVRRALELPPTVHPVALLPLGYPAEEGRPKHRKPLAEVVHEDRWQRRDAAR